jgi:hypothetical protein
MISKLVKDYAGYQAKKKGMPAEKYISQLLKKNGSK